MAAKLVRIGKPLSPTLLQSWIRVGHSELGKGTRAEGQRGRARAGVGALGANFAHQPSEEIGSKRGRDEREKKRRKEVAMISYPSLN